MPPKADLTREQMEALARWLEKRMRPADATEAEDVRGVPTREDPEDDDVINDAMNNLPMEMLFGDAAQTGVNPVALMVDRRDEPPLAPQRVRPPDRRQLQQLAVVAAPRAASPAPIPLPIVVQQQQLRPRLAHPAVVNRGNRNLPLNARARNWVFVGWIRPGGSDRHDPPGTYLDNNGDVQRRDLIGYISEQVEETETEAPHWQGYVELEDPMLMVEMAQVLGLKPGHYWAAPAYAPDKMAAINYTQKDETAVLVNGHKTQYIAGAISGFSASGVWGAVHDVIKHGGDFMDVIERFPGIAIRCGGGVMRGIAAYNKPQARPTHKSLVFWGVPRSGKTTLAETIYGAENTFVRGTHKDWWDGYDGEDVVVLDEMTPNKFPLADFLRWTSGNKLTYEVRGATVPAKNNYTIVTSNIPVEEWYPNASAMHKLALAERFPPSQRFYFAKKWEPPVESTVEVLVE